MPKLEDHTVVEDGIVMGYVSTDKTGSECTFEICPVDEWLELTQEESEETARDAFYGSGVMAWGF